MHWTRVLALIVLLVGQVHSLSWDVVVAGYGQLEFYYNGTLIHLEEILSYTISSVTYDPVHTRLLYAGYEYPTTSIFSFDLSTRETQSLFTKAAVSQLRVVHDPVTQALYWRDERSIYSFSLNPASSNKAADGNLLVTLNSYCHDVALDSCGGHIYWITHEEIGRIRLDGSEREVLINSSVNARLSLAIDQQTQRMYWTEKTHSGDEHVAIKSANFNGKDITTLYNVRGTKYAISLAVSKDFIYWQNYDQLGIWQLPKNQTLHKARKLETISSADCALCQHVAANYRIEEQIRGIKNCDALQALIPNDSKSQQEEGKKESPDPTCQKYCFQGECRVSAAQKPICSCKAGYSGERCEVNACHQYCLNGGVCSLNESSAPVCRCTADFEGERCDVSAFVIKCIQTVSMLKDILNADVASFALGKGVQSSCASPVV